LQAAAQRGSKVRKRPEYGERRPQTSNLILAIDLFLIHTGAQRTTGLLSPFSAKILR